MSDVSTDLEPVPADTPLELMNRSTGEIVDLRDGSDLQLVEIVEAIGQERGVLKDDEALVHAELLRRLDRAGQWTLHVHEDRDHRPRTWIVKAPSPTVGSTRVDPERLRDALGALVADDSIHPDLATAALKRTVTITATVAIDTDLQALSDALRGLDAINGQPVSDVQVSTGEVVAAEGCNRLRKAGHGAVVDAATVPAVPTARRVSVKPVLP